MWPPPAAWIDWFIPVSIVELQLCPERVGVSDPERIAHIALVASVDPTDASNDSDLPSWPAKAFRLE